MQVKTQSAKGKKEILALLAGVLSALMLAASEQGCDRKAEEVQTVTRPANAINGPTTAQTDADDADLKASLEPIPYVGLAVGVTMPDGDRWQKYPSGLMMQEIKPGKPEHARIGQMAHVAYVGTLPGSNAVFDSADKDHPFVFQVGSKNIIKGWNYAISTMGIGAKRRIYLPLDLAYGMRGSLPKIGPNQPLIFEIELLDVTGLPMYSLEGLPASQPAKLLTPQVAGPTTAPATGP